MTVSVFVVVVSVELGRSSSPFEEEADGWSSSLDGEEDCGADDEEGGLEEEDPEEELFESGEGTSADDEGDSDKVTVVN